MSLFIAASPPACILLDSDFSDACFSFSDLDSRLKQFTMARPRKKSTANAPAAEPSPPPPPRAEVKNKGRQAEL